MSQTLSYRQKHLLHMHINYGLFQALSRAWQVTRYIIDDFVDRTAAVAMSHGTDERLEPVMALCVGERLNAAERTLSASFIYNV